MSSENSTQKGQQEGALVIMGIMIILTVAVDSPV